MKGGDRGERQEQMTGKNNRMYNVGVYYLEFPQWLQITFNNIANKNKSSSFFQLLSFANIEEIPDNKPPRYTSCYLFPPFALPPINPIRNLKNDPPQIGEFYLPLSPPNVLGGGHCYRYYISFLYIYYISYIF